MVLFFRRTTPPDGPLDKRVLVAQTDVEARDQLIRDYLPFVLKVVAKVVGRYVTMGEDDEVSIGLMAFDEAITCYQSERSGSFLGFAETIIKRRLVDYYRKQRADRRETAFSTYIRGDEEKNALQQVELTAAQAVHEQSVAQAERREEIMRFSQEIDRFGISFSELAEISPRHQDARVRAREAARLVARDADHWQHLCRRGELRLKELEAQVSVSRKTLERQRKYIIALAVILAGDYPHLAGYLSE